MRLAQRYRQMAFGGGWGTNFGPQPKPKPGLFATNRRGYVDSVLNANKNLDWIQRLTAPNAPSLQVPGEPYPSTHLMSDDGNGYVFPSVVRNKAGNLTYLGDSAEDYARETNTGIQLPKKEGTWFAANGYKIGTRVNNSVSPTGVPYNDPHYKIQRGDGGPIKPVSHWQDVYKRNGRLPGYVWNQFTPQEQLNNFGVTYENANQSTAFNSLLKQRTAYGDVTGGTDWVADNNKLQDLSSRRAQLPRDQYLQEMNSIARNINDPNAKYGNLRGSHPVVRPENINASQDAYNLFLGEPQEHNSWTISKYRPSVGKDTGKNYFALKDNSEIVNDLFKYNNKDFIDSPETERFVKGSHVGQASLKNFKYSKGKDEKGNYVSYYDVNDYGNPLDAVGKPFEVYDRVYYDPTTRKPVKRNGGLIKPFANAY